MLFTPSVSSDTNLLWSKDEFDVYFKLFDFSNSLQVYVKPFHAIHNEVGDVVTILFLQFYILIVVWISRTLMYVSSILLMIMFLLILLFAINFLVILRMMFLRLFVILSFILILSFSIILLFLRYVKNLTF
jgi:hypothetical protein